MAIQTFKRYEKKYLIAASELPSLIRALSPYMEPDPYCIDGNRYVIHNIYFDTDDFDVIRASNMKPYYKEKLRLRSYYDNLTDEDTVFLELKKKIGGIVNKRRTALKIGEIDSIIANPALIADMTEDNSTPYMKRQIMSEIEYFLSRYRVKPAAYISYRRLAFFCRDNKEIRITFDTDLRYNFDSPTLRSTQQYTPILGDDVILAEVKIIGAFPLWLAGIFSEFDMRKTSFSKYGTAYEMHRFHEDRIFDKYRLASPRCIIHSSRKVIEHHGSTI